MRASISWLSLMPLSAAISTKDLPSCLAAITSSTFMLMIDAISATIVIRCPGPTGFGAPASGTICTGACEVFCAEPTGVSGTATCGVASETSSAKVRPTADITTRRAMTTVVMLAIRILDVVFIGLLASFQNLL